MSDPKFPAKLYVPEKPDNYDRYSWRDDGWPSEWADNIHDNARAHVHTVSPGPNQQGWENDGGFSGYGLPRPIAKEICRRWNAFVVDDEGHLVFMKVEDGD